jgi:hypothetical protein
MVVGTHQEVEMTTTSPTCSTGGTSAYRVDHGIASSTGKCVDCGKRVGLKADGTTKKHVAAR